MRLFLALAAMSAVDSSSESQSVSFLRGETDISGQPYHRRYHS